jgi:hypothetical protein
MTDPFQHHEKGQKISDIYAISYVLFYAYCGGEV